MSCHHRAVATAYAGLGVIAEIALDGSQVAAVDLVPVLTPAPVGSPPCSPGASLR